MGIENSQELGTIEVAVGPMFANKTGWLTYKLEHPVYLKHPLLLVTHINEVLRVGPKILKSRTGKVLSAENAGTADEIYALMVERGLFDKSAKPRILAVDEIQFFDTKLAQLAVEAQRSGIRVYAAGLDQYFNEEFCPTTAAMIAVANKVEKLLAGCDVCGLENATRTQRLVNGIPAPFDDPKEVVGDKKSLNENRLIDAVTYGARCLNHHIVPGKPKFT